jgi:hypothetical protein
MKTELKPRSHISSLSLDGRYAFRGVEVGESKLNSLSEIEIRQSRLKEHYNQRMELSDQHD